MQFMRRGWERGRREPDARGARRAPTPPHRRERSRAVARGSTQATRPTRQELTENSTLRYYSGAIIFGFTLRRPRRATPHPQMRQGSHILGLGASICKLLKHYTHKHTDTDTAHGTRHTAHGAHDPRRPLRPTHLRPFRRRSAGSAEGTRFSCREKSHGLPGTALLQFPRTFLGIRSRADRGSGAHAHVRAPVLSECTPLHLMPPAPQGMAFLGISARTLFRVEGSCL